MSEALETWDDPFPIIQQKTDYEKKLESENAALQAKLVEAEKVLKALANTCGSPYAWNYQTACGDGTKCPICPVIVKIKEPYVTKV